MIMISRLQFNKKLLKHNISPFFSSLLELDHFLIFFPFFPFVAWIGIEGGGIL